MSSETLGTVRRILMIGAADLQTRLLAEHLSAATGTPCTVRPEIVDAMNGAALSGEPLLLLVDERSVEKSLLYDTLKRTAQPDHMMVGVFNVDKDDEFVASLLHFGTRGVFDVDQDIDMLVRGVQALLNGDVWIPRRVLLRAALEPAHTREVEHPVSDLTRREKEILAMICAGGSNDEIGSKLHISTSTVKTHIHNLYRKIGAPNRMQAALWAARNL